MREQRVESFYAKLRHSATSSSSSSPVLIFPSTSDVDSLCALKIILHILQSDSIQYACYPVSSFHQIHKYVSSASNDDPLSVVLVNWGNHRDLRKTLNLSPNARVFVVDSHRPIHLRNLSDQNDTVTVLFTKDDEQQSDLAYDFDLTTLANAGNENSESESESESEAESESDSDSEAESERDGSRKRRRKNPEEDPIKLYRKLKKDYYRLGTFHGKPSGCLMYELAHFLRRNTNELLWLACVSLTDQFVHERLSEERYHDGVMELEQHINSSGNLDAPTSVTLKDGTKIRAPNSSRITYEDQPRLMLLQEWNLFDSMMCSSYIATKLKTWSENGMKKLKLLFGRMGFALADCQQKFQYMNVEVKRKMRQEFEKFLPEYGLTDFYYRSFMRVYRYSRVSAADVVFGVTALLESFVKSDGSCASQKFGEAYDALLSLDNINEKLEKGMQKAIKIQRAILRQGSAAITKSGCIRSGRSFRWLKLEDSRDAELLGHPQALTKFCYFLMDALKEKGATMKPLLCACLSQEAGKVLIVGVCGRPRLAGARGNAFGIAFRTAAEEIGTEFFHELFESSWIVLDASAVNSFMVRLIEKL